MQISHDPSYNFCQTFCISLVGKMIVDQSKIDMKTLVKKHRSMQAVKEGGRWNPTNCTAKRKVGLYELIFIRNLFQHK